MEGECGSVGVEVVDLVQKRWNSKMKREEHKRAAMRPLRFSLNEVQFTGDSAHQYN